MRLLHDEQIPDVPLIGRRVISGCQTEHEALHEEADDHAHLLQGEVFANAVCRSEGKRDERRGIVHERILGDARLRCGLVAGCDEPAVGPERRRMRRKVARVAVHGIDVERSVRAFGQVTVRKRESDTRDVLAKKRDRRHTKTRCASRQAATCARCHWPGRG